MTTLSKTVLDELQQRESARMRRFDALALAAARGDRVDPVDVEATMQQANKSLADFSREVERHKQRVVFREQYDKGIWSARSALARTATPEQRTAYAEADRQMAQTRQLVVARRSRVDELLARNPPASAGGIRAAQADVAAAVQALEEAKAAMDQAFAAIIEP